MLKSNLLVTSTFIPQLCQRPGLYYQKLIYCRKTTRHAILINSCNISRGMEVRKASNSKSDLQGHWQ